MVQYLLFVVIKSLGFVGVRQKPDEALDSFDEMQERECGLASTEM